tara:strand:- start:555 stop:773 length:219 start_codon:yes stop_codon:yes gene_type:complete
MALLHRTLDITTGKETTRDYTPEEIAEREAAQLAQAEINAADAIEAEAKATAKAELLEKLGISSEEASLLLS